jgi:hypothetical protein
MVWAKAHFTDGSHPNPRNRLLPLREGRWGNIITPKRFGKGFLQGSGISRGYYGIFSGSPSLWTLRAFSLDNPGVIY